MARTLPVEGPLDRPEVMIAIGGVELTRAQRSDVMRADVHEEVGRLARASLLIRNWQDEPAGVKHSDSHLFAPGRDIEIRMGYGSELETVFDGVIVGQVGQFRQDAQPVLEVHCRCRGEWLATARRSRLFEESTDGDAAAAIASEYGLSARTGGSPAHRALVQWSASDWDFLALRARALGRAFYMRGRELVFARPELGGEAALSLEWGGTLLELEAHHDITHATGAEVSGAWDPAAVEAVEGRVSADASDVSVSAAAPTVSGVLGDAGWEQREARWSRPAPLSAEELDAWSQARVNRAAQGHLHLAGRARGIPRLRIDSLLDVGGVGERWSGVHYVTAVRHTLDRSGYFTEFRLGLPPALRPGEDDRLLPRATGPVIGIVEDIDDPDGRGQVRVRFPWLDEQLGAIWARLALPAAGADRGFFFIPDVGDEVIVDFLHGDPRYPVVLGSLWNGRDAPPEALDAGANALRSIVSRAGHRFTFDDSEGGAAMVLRTAGGHRIALDDGAEALEIADSAGNSIRMDSGGIALAALPGGDITVDASSGKVALSSLQLEASASGQAKIESSGTLELQAAATLGITGALVKINS